MPPATVTAGEDRGKRYNTIEISPKLGGEAPRSMNGKEYDRRGRGVDTLGAFIGKESSKRPRLHKSMLSKKEISTESTQKCPTRTVTVGKTKVKIERRRALKRSTPLCCERFSPGQRYHTKESHL